MTKGADIWVFVEAYPGCTTSEIEKGMGLSNLSGHMSSMAADGYIERGEPRRTNKHWSTTWYVGQPYGPEPRRNDMKNRCWGCGQPAPAGVCTRRHLGFGEVHMIQARVRGDVADTQRIQREEREVREYLPVAEDTEPEEPEAEPEETSPYDGMTEQELREQLARIRKARWSRERVTA